MNKVFTPNNISLNGILISFAFIFFLILASCESPTDPKIDKPTGGGGGGGGSDSLKTIIVSGTILNSQTSVPLDSAIVKFIYGNQSSIVITNASGLFTIQLKLDSSQTVKMVVARNKFYTDSTSIFVNVANSTLALSPFELRPISAGIVVNSGPPSSIYLLSQSTTFIGVQQSGSIEVARLTFQVVDSAGNRVDLANSANVKFRFATSPNGGEFLSHDSVATDTAGTATVYVTSGTRAGVCQVIAEFFVNNRLVRSTPVALAIHGGLPDLAHFSAAPSLLNIPGWHILGIEDAITAYVGDKFSNPVRPNTVVYYNTTGGIIGGSALTDEMGRATVNLMSAAPQPIHPTLGPGFATVTCHTADENNQTITTNTIVLFSGPPILSISPTTFDIPNRSAQSFTYTLMDLNGNPMAGGTTISVTGEGEGISLRGSTDVTIPDTQSPAWTQFSFTLIDVDTVNFARPVFISVVTNGPNGSARVDISGTVR